MKIATKKALRIAVLLIFLSIHADKDFGKFLCSNRLFLHSDHVGLCEVFCALS